jgi:exonuclease III
LDYFVVSEDTMPLVVDSSIHPEFDGSDHVPIKLELNLEKA